MPDGAEGLVYILRGFLEVNMEKTGFTHSLPFRLLVALAVGIGVGLALSAAEGAAITNALLNIIVTVKFISSQFINFCVPLIIIGFIAPSITRLGNNASRMLVVALIIAYLSSIGAAFFATGAGFTILPFLNISPEVDGLKELPPVVFELTIPQIMPVMSALFFSVLVPHRLCGEARHQGGQSRRHLKIICYMKKCLYKQPHSRLLFCASTRQR